MKIILIKDINKVGSAGDVLKVADGFARNYLLPKKFAIIATKRNVEKIETIKKEAELVRLEVENKFKAIAMKLTDVQLEFIRKADENGHLFGSVSEIDVANALIEKEFEVHKSNVNMSKHLKEIGTFDVEIMFTTEITANIKVNIENE
jgi:large subunit ribosomal protein L9